MKFNFSKGRREKQWRRTIFILFLFPLVLGIILYFAISALIHSQISEQGKLMTEEFKS